MAERLKGRGADAVILTRTWSDAEADIIVGLLATHDIYAWTASDLAHGAYPYAMDGRGDAPGLSEVRVFVGPEDAEEASAILAEVAEDLGTEAPREGRG